MSMTLPEILTEADRRFGEYRDWLREHPGSSEYSKERHLFSSHVTDHWASLSEALHERYPTMQHLELARAVDLHLFDPSTDPAEPSPWLEKVRFSGERLRELASAATDNTYLRDKVAHYEQLLPATWHAAQAAVSDVFRKLKDDGRKSEFDSADCFTPAPAVSALSREPRRRQPDWTAIENQLTRALDTILNAVAGAVDADVAQAEMDDALDEAHELLWTHENRLRPQGIPGAIRALLAERDQLKKDLTAGHGEDPDR